MRKSLLKLTAVLLALMLIISVLPLTASATETTEPETEDTFIVAGAPADIFGTAWDGTNEANTMTKNDDGTYTKDYTVDKAYNEVQLKAVRNDEDWFGEADGHNVIFTLTGAGTFTVTATPTDDSYVVSVSGDIVEEITEFEYDTVFAVGNGEGTWLNGAGWDPDAEANEMIEVDDDVWEISFEDVPEGFERQIKFAIDGKWTHTFGGAFEDSGVESAAAYNGNDITFDTDDTCTVTAQLDLSEFDFASKTGAKFTITIDYDEPEPEETTEPDETTEPETEDTFIVAGAPADIFGTAWDGTNEANLMTANDDGTYTKDYTVDKAFSAVQLKAVRNGEDWFGEADGHNVIFNLTGAGTFTVTATPTDDSYVVSVSGDIVEEITTFEYDTVFAVGNGEGNWLNGAGWDPDAEANEMIEVDDDVWEISFEDVPEGFERQIKFAIDGAWIHNFGGAFAESGVATDAAYNGNNITFDTDDTCTVTAQLDLSNFDFATKTGAKFTITIDYDEPEPEETTEPETEDTFIVAGTPADIFGSTWNGSYEVNRMTKNDDGKYIKEYTVDRAYPEVELHTVKDYWETMGDNVSFGLNGAGTFTVVYDPEENRTSVTGDIVTAPILSYEKVYAVGNGEGTWLNGMAWSPDAAANEMTEVADDVWEISFYNVSDGFERQIKFTIDGAWTHYFGGAFEDSGVESAAAYNGENITFDTDDYCTVTAQLDLREFDYASKTGAKYTITIDYHEPEDIYIAAGSSAEIFGAAWSDSRTANIMTKNDDGTYSRDYTVDKAYPEVELHTVRHAVSNDWYYVGNNVMFGLNGAGTFTVVYDPEENRTSVTGDIVTDPKLSYEKVCAVGNGEGNWLNGEDWNPDAEANELTEVADDVWEITFEDVPAGFERQIEFAIDSGWTHNFGGTFVDSGEETDADYNGDNITFDTYGLCTVKAQLDLSGFDYKTKSGAKFTVTITYNDPDTEDIYIVAGSSYEIFGSVDNGKDVENAMTKADDGTYTKEYTVDKAYDVIQLKTVKDGTEWIGDKDDNYVFFGLKGAGTFTVVYDPAENYTYVTGEIIKEPEFNYDAVYAVGNGSGFWLNGKDWDYSAEENRMTEVEDDVWEITFENVTSDSWHDIYFSIDGDDNRCFGGEFYDSGEETDADYNGGSIMFYTYRPCSVTARLDLSNFDIKTKTGAKFTITVKKYAKDYEGIFIAAGNSEEIFGTYWDGLNTDNTMTKAEDGTYTKDYTVDKPYRNVQLQTVKNGSDWIGDAAGGNVTFNLTGAGTFTVVYDPAENYTYVRGDIVKVPEFNYDAVYAAGDGSGFWLNNSWYYTAEKNKMTEVAEDVWEITFDNVTQKSWRNIYFSMVGENNCRFGGDFSESGIETAAAYNGGSIWFYTDELCSVTARLDLRDFDFLSMTGAKFTITINKYDPDYEGIFIAAGNYEEIFGTTWDAYYTANAMTKTEDGTYIKNYIVDKAFSGVQLKTVKNGSDWIGDAAGGNVTFDLTGAGTFTAVYDPAENYTYVTGDIVKAPEFNYDAVYAVGDGSGFWLNDKDWDDSAEENKMTEVAKDVWEITFDNVTQKSWRNICFSIDGDYNRRFGGDFSESGIETAAAYNGGSIRFYTDAPCSVTARLDLSRFNYLTKKGARFTITVNKYDKDYEGIFIVAGNYEEIFGTTWDAYNTANTMTKAEDGTYIKDYTVDKAFSGVQLLTYKNGTDMIADASGNNVTFDLTGAGTFTVICDPAGNYTYVTGDIVKVSEFSCDEVYAAGNGSGSWLNGISWYESAEENKMTEVADDVWEITFENVTKGSERKIFFAINGYWDDRFGGAFEKNNAVSDAVFNGDTITFDTKDICNVTVTLDLTEFNNLTNKGAKFKISIDYNVKGHTCRHVFAPAKAPTCTETGLTEGEYCDLCGKVFVAQEVIPATGHIEVIDPGKPATCTEAGLTEGSYCSVCGEVLVAQEEIPAAGHHYVYVWPTPADCTNDGLSMGVQCEDCGDWLIEQTVIPAAGHKIVIDPAVPATCTHDGLTEGSHCSVCGEVFVAQEVIPATGHIEVIDPGKPATCTETGLTEGSYCSVCGEVIVAQEVIPMLGHELCIIPHTPADFDHDGLSCGVKCSRCGEILIEQEVVSAIGNEIVIVNGISPTCTEPGLTDARVNLTTGDILQKQEVIPALGHDEESVAGTPSEYTHTGLTDGIRCAHCGEWLVEQEVIDKLVSDYPVGDSNRDRIVNIRDVTAIQRYVAELSQFEDEQLALADLNGDGVVNINDATYLQRYFAEFDGYVLKKQS